MTSKEALDNLYQGSLNPENCLYATFRFRTDAGNKITNDYKVVKKDLEVLEQYKKTEEELGIELLTLFKALNNGAWTKFNNEISKCDECEYEMLDIYIYFYWNSGKHLVFLLSDYGKTWALTKEELENEK